MDSIIPFLDESEQPFSHEDIIKARTMIMENLNNLLTASSSQIKIELVTKIQEQVLKWAPAMRVLEEVIDDILAISLDQNQDVKKSIIGFIEEVCKQKIRMLPKVIKCIAMFLRSESAILIKRVTQACGSIYKNTLQWMCSTEDVTEEMKDCWEQLCLIKAQILDMIDHENDGVRTNAIKFLEGVILLQTHLDPDSMKKENDFSLADVPLTLTHIRRRKLEEEAMNIFEILLKFHGASHISSVNLIACTGTLCTIAKMRPALMGQVVEALKSLHSSFPPTLTNSQIASIRKNLKMQFINLLKQPASFDWRTTIIPILQDLGASQNEINRSLPKMDKKEIQMRTKRALENEEARSQAKRARLEEKKKLILDKVPKDDEMEVDEDTIFEQQRRSDMINEKFIADAIKNVEVAAQLVITSMTKLPDKIPDSFIKNYQPSIGPVTITNQIDKIARNFAAQLTEVKLGPGSKELTADEPLKPKISVEEEQNIIMGEDYQKDETTRKLRETLERMKDQPKLKQRIRTLKLQEITKPLHKDLKQQFLNDAVRRVLKCERQALVSGMGFKRKKIITVFGSTFMPSVREIIMEYIMEDIIKRFDLAFMWLFEEYSLMQGFTRFSYVKSEHKHDYAYNRLLSELVLKILNRGSEFRERESLIKRLYLEAPCVSDESVDILTRICENDDLYECGLVLLKDLLIRRPPREEYLLETLLKFSVHQNTLIREKAIENVMIVYTMHQIMLQNIETFAVKSVNFLQLQQPTEAAMKYMLFSDLNPPEAWTEDMTKSLLNLYLVLLPHNESLIQELSAVYVAATPDVKRIILRNVEVPVKKLGIESKPLLKLLDVCAKGTETLITRIIYILTENSSPTQELIDKVKHLYNTKLNDVRILIPIVLHLTKKEIIAALPKFLKLNPQLMKDVLMRLLGVKTEAQRSSLQPITPTELLVSLHAIDTQQAELKLIVKATSLCIAEKDVYTHEVLGVVMQQLVEMNPLPTLLMRTVIQSHTLYPRLSGFITNLLQRLIVKQVWKNKLIWDGFVKCCQKLQPQSMGVMIQLPASQLQDALQICPDLKAPLLEYAREMNKHQISHVTSQVLEVLGESQTEPTPQEEPDAPGI
ncbi:symplekin [Chironomus tepperi]|uniref:symplekin n=1 Tax=Chironomus tepperi TaxID=113505 RepID=UPI00391F5830